MFNHAKKYKEEPTVKSCKEALSYKFYTPGSNLVQQSWYLWFDRGRGSIDNWNFGRQNLLAGGDPCWRHTKGFHATNIGTIPSLRASAGSRAIH